MSRSFPSPSGHGGRYRVVFSACQLVVLVVALPVIHPAVAQEPTRADARRLEPPTQPAAAVASAPAKPMGELRIEGRFIKRLILCRRVPGRDYSDPYFYFQDEGDNTLTLDSPGSTVMLPVGEYNWGEVDLDSGTEFGQFMSYNYTALEWLRVTEGQPATLKIGGPLKCTVEVRRHGSALELAEMLVGVGGERYMSQIRTETPRFTVYKNDEPVGSGQFEFG